jgi:lipoprotein signal peptidase
MPTQTHAPALFSGRSGLAHALVAIALVTVAVDLSTKYLAFAVAPAYSGRDVGHIGFIRPLTNPAFSLRLASTSPTLSVLLMSSGLTAGIILAARWLRKGRSAPWALGLTIGGAAANTADRALHGAVQDFILVGPVVLNIADLAVFAGLAAIAYRAGRRHIGGRSVRIWPHKPERKENHPIR